MSKVIAYLGLLSFLLANPASAQDVTLDEDTIIDATSSLSGLSIAVVDGLDGPTNVGIVDSGSVRGFNIREHSQVILDGGAVTFLSSLEDNATFVMKDGQLGCFESICQLIDYDADLTASDSTSLHFFGGQLNGIVRLRDQSTAYFYGRNLVLNVFDESFAAVGGLYLDGTPIGVAFHFRPDINVHVVLHNLPEPSVIMGHIALLSVFVLIRNRTDHRWN